MLYLTALELAELLDCKANQFAIMARRLKTRGWPFEQFPGGCPKVLRSYHDQRIRGEILVTPVAQASAPAEFTPNRAALQALQNRSHARKRQAA